MKVCLGCKGCGEDWVCFDKHAEDPARRIDFDDLSTLERFEDGEIEAVKAFHSFEHMRRESFVPFVLALARKCRAKAKWAVMAPLATDPVSIGNPHHTNNIFLPFTFDFFGPPNGRNVEGWTIGSGTAGVDEDWIFERVSGEVVTAPSGVRTILYILEVRSK
jgi:hypothetical protein